MNLGMILIIFGDIFCMSSFEIPLINIIRYAYTKIPIPIDIITTGIDVSLEGVINLYINFTG